MAREGKRLTIGRREVALGLALVPLTSFNPPNLGPAPKGKASTPNPGAAFAADSPAQLMPLLRLDPTLKLDIKYASADNFIGHALYEEPAAFLISKAAQALVRAHASAKADGYGFTIYDAYRPLSATKIMWDATPRHLRNYVANPKRGSKHNRGCAVDLTLHDLATGQQVEMPSSFDEFTKRAHRDYMAASPQAISNRDRLERYMEAEGFRGMSNEWWHFDFIGWEQFPILDVPFNEIT